jgi:phage tail sheath protein FI
VVLPPSSAMAGVYGRVDSTRGIWKAPANVSLNYVIAPTEKISDQEQSAMHAHISGKSINAIRTFTGKGTLVWGARTVDGQDKKEGKIIHGSIYRYAVTMT